MKKHGFGLFFTFMVVIVVAMGVSSCATILTTLPQDARVVPPVPEIGVASRYSGIWHGRGLPGLSITTIVVEKIEPSKRVQAIYSWGYGAGDFARVTGQVMENTDIVLEWGEITNRRIMTLHLQNNDRLAIKFEKDGRIFNSEIERYVPPPPKK